MDTYSDRKRTEPVDGSSDLRALWQDQTYIQVLARLHKGRDKIENWLKGKWSNASSVNIIEGFDSAISALERAIIRRKPYALQIVQAGFPYDKVEKRIFDLATRAVGELSKPRAAFRSNVGNRKDVGQVTRLAVNERAADNGESEPQDLIDDLCDSLDTDVESADTGQTGEIGESNPPSSGASHDEHVQFSPGLKWQQHGSEMMADDLTLEQLQRAERLERCDALQVQLRKDDPDAYRLICLWLAHTNIKSSISFSAYAAGEFGCSEAAIRKRLERALTLLRGSLGKVEL